MIKNQIVLSGIVEQAEVLRYTPAGVPVYGFALRHRSTQPLAGAAFDAQVQVDCRAAGAVAESLSALSPAAHIVVRGFLALKHRRGRDLVLHVYAFQELQDTTETGESAHEKSRS